MSYLTKYGTLWGAIPQTAGRVFWVAAGDSYVVDGETYLASNDNNGLSPAMAKRRVDNAVDAATQAGDVVVLLPGDHTVTASIAADSANVTIMGLPGGRGNYMKPRATLACSAVDQTINVTAAGVEIAHIYFVSTTSQASALIDFSAAADNLYIHDCGFDMYTATAASTILGIDAIGANNWMLIERCYFSVDGAFGACIDLTATLDAVVSDCVFMNSAGTQTATITVGAATDRFLINHCTFLISNAAVVSGCIDGTGATIASGGLIQDCRFGDRSTIAVAAFTAGECELAENYEAGVGAADGGVLITAIA